VTSESRENDRFEHQSPITREDIRTGIHYGAKMYNYSRGGLYFEADYLLQPEDEIFIGIENSPYASAQGIYECYRAKVIWRKDLDGRRFYLYGYGIQFYYPNHISPMTNEGDLPEKPASQRTPPDRRDYTREFPRRPYIKRIIFTSKNRFYEGLVKNISRKGAFIRTVERFAVGQQLSMVVPLGNKKRGIKLQGNVVWSGPEGFGVEFKVINKT
jgi:hypothetical protein